SGCGGRGCGRGWCVGRLPGWWCGPDSGGGSCCAPVRGGGDRDGGAGQVDPHPGPAQASNGDGHSVFSELSFREFLSGEGHCPVRGWPPPPALTGHVGPLWDVGVPDQRARVPTRDRAEPGIFVPRINRGPGLGGGHVRHGFLLFAVVADDGVLDVLVDEFGGLLDPVPDTARGGIGQVDSGERVEQVGAGGHQNGPPIRDSMRSWTSRSWARRSRCAVSAAICASSSAMRSTPPTITVPLPTSVAVYPAARSALMTSVVVVPER